MGCQPRNRRLSRLQGVRARLLECGLIVALSVAVWGVGQAQLILNGPYGELDIPEQLAKPPFWRQALAPCGLASNDTGVRPNRCANNVDFCFPDPYQPTFQVCTPCYKACLDCTRCESPPRNCRCVTCTSQRMANAVTDVWLGKRGSLNQGGAGSVGV